jgi:hypothetical protein
MHCTSIPSILLQQQQLLHCTSSPSILPQQQLQQGDAVPAASPFPLQHRKASQILMRYMPFVATTENSLTPTWIKQCYIWQQQRHLLMLAPASLLLLLLL